MTTTEKKYPNAFTADDIDLIVAGKVVAPNFEPIDLEEACAFMLMGTVNDRHGWFKTAGAQSYSRTARYFEEHGQGGQQLGQGVVIYSAGWDGERHKYGIKAGRWVLCKHEHVAHAGADPRRGWRPAHCGKCGVSLTVDSGD